MQICHYLFQEKKFPLKKWTNLHWWFKLVIAHGEGKSCSKAWKHWTSRSVTGQGRMEKADSDWSNVHLFTQRNIIDSNLKEDDWNTFQYCHYAFNSKLLFWFCIVKFKGLHIKYLHFLFSMRQHYLDLETHFQWGEITKSCKLQRELGTVQKVWCKALYWKHNHVQNIHLESQHWPKQTTYYHTKIRCPPTLIICFLTHLSFCPYKSFHFLRERCPMCLLDWVG